MTYTSKRTKTIAIILVLALVFSIAPNFLLGNATYANDSFPLTLETVEKNVVTRASYDSNSKVVNTYPTVGTILVAEASKVNSSKNLWYKLRDGTWVYSKRVKQHTNHVVDRCGVAVNSYAEITDSILYNKDWNAGLNINNRQATLQTFTAKHIKKTTDGNELCRCGYIVIKGTSKIEFENHAFNSGYCNSCYALDPRLKEKNTISYEELSTIYDTCGLFLIWCDVANLELAIRNGKTFDAIANGIAFIPILGDGVAFLIKKGNQTIGAIGKFIGNIVEFGKLINKTKTIADIADSAKTAKKLSDAIDITSTHNRLFGFSRGFDNWDKFRDWLGSAGSNRNWHHIVEQCQTNSNRAKFAENTVQNTDNIINISADVHNEISKFYSKKQAISGGVVFRDWLSGMSFEEQYEWGLWVLSVYGVKV